MSVVILAIDAEASSFQLAFTGTPDLLGIPIGDCMALRIEINISGVRISYPFITLRETVSSFTACLQSFSEQLEGSVAFLSANGDVNMRLAVVERGHLLLGGRLLMVPPQPTLLQPPDTTFLNNGLHFGTEITFDGIECDQSYLPGMVDALKKSVAMSAAGEV